MKSLPELQKSLEKDSSILLISFLEVVLINRGGT